MIEPTTFSKIDTLPELLTALDRIEQPLSSSALSSLVNRLPIAAVDFLHFTTFHPDRVRIHEIYRSNFIEANFLCWRAGHRSPIHDHRGSACCVKVIDGLLTNVDYCRDEDGTLHELNRVELWPGEVLQRHDLRIHRCANRHPEETLMTLHFYSPPLAPMAARSSRTRR